MGARGLNAMLGGHSVVVGQRRTNNIESLVLASQIIDTLVRYKEPVGVSTLAHELDFSKARISRFLTTMLDLGLVKRGLPVAVTPWDGTCFSLDRWQPRTIRSPNTLSATLSS